MFKDYNSQYSNRCCTSIQTTSVSQNENEPPFYISDPYYYKRYLESVPPADAYFFFPQGEEVMIENPKKPSRALRRIYINTTFTEYELKALKEFKKMIEASHFPIPDYWTDADNVRFIYSTNFNLQKAFTQMCEHLNWRKKYFPMYFTPGDKVFQILNLGFAYVYGRDHQFRPIIICQPYVYVQHEKEFTYEEWMRASVFICEYAANHMLIPGQIENWVMITNIRHVSAIFLPKEMKKVINIMSDNFRAKLYINYIIGMSKTLRILYSIVVRFLDEITVKKLVIINDVKDGKILQNIRKENLEKKFGGSAPDLIPGKDNMFPPRMPDNGGRYILDSEKKENVLISREEYIKRMNNKMIDTVSPYVIKEIEEEEEAEEQKEKERIQKEIEREKEERKQELCKDINEMLNDTNWVVSNEFDPVSTDTPSSHMSLKSLSSYNSLSARSRQRTQQIITDFNKRKAQHNWSINFV